MPPKKKAGDKKESGAEDTQARIAIVNADRCRPKKCHQECKKSCPVVKLGKLCIEVDGKSKLAFISEPLCIGTFLYVLFCFGCSRDNVEGTIGHALVVCHHHNISSILYHHHRHQVVVSV